MRHTRSLYSNTLLAGLLAGTVLVVGCSQDAAVGGAVGAAAVGGAYEYQNKRALDRLEDEYRNGRISRREYERRRQEIKNRSIIY